MQYITEFYISQNCQVIKFSNRSNGLNPIIWTNISCKYFKIVFQFWENFFRTSTAFQLSSCFVFNLCKQCAASKKMYGSANLQRKGNRETTQGKLGWKHLWQVSLLRAWLNPFFWRLKDCQECLLTKYYIQTYKFKTALARTYPGSVIAEKIWKTLHVVNKISDIYNVFLENIGF